MEQSESDVPAAKEITASITSRGQVTMPAEIRELLGLEHGGKVIFVIGDDGVTLKKPRFTMKSVGGSVPPLKKKLSWAQMRKIAQEDAAAYYLQKAAREEIGRE
jgi:AbrB family looped-hinge helix DNA binding protein